MIQFFNTLSGRVEPFIPITPDEVKLYTCGPTVYDHPHIGNYRAYIFEDLLKRFLLFMGFKVRHVMNITDVDDKTIRNARGRGQGLDDYTRPHIDAFHRGIKTLNILPADFYPRATEHIQGMVEMVKGLVEKGYAYEKDGSYYFSIAKFSGYGRLSKLKLEDLHTGGVDNIFPHHENEIAQSEAYWGVKFVNHWLHCHHLIVNGEKMSKSKGNFFTLNDVLEKGADPMAL